MTDFLEKLKRGMGVKVSVKEPEQKKEEGEEKLEEDKSSSRAEPDDRKVRREKRTEFSSNAEPDDRKVGREKRTEFSSNTELLRSKSEGKEEDEVLFAPLAAAREKKIQERKKIDVNAQKEPEFKEDKSSSHPLLPSEARDIEIKKEKWFEPEGELAVDVYQTEEEIVVQSPIAGIRSENLDIFVENDVLLIRGNRQKPDEIGQRDYFYQECYWGPFSRQIILSKETDPDRITAEMKEGVLIIRIPKVKKEKNKKIIIKN